MPGRIARAPPRLGPVARALPAEDADGALSRGNRCPGTAVEEPPEGDRREFPSSWAGFQEAADGRRAGVPRSVQRSVKAVPQAIQVGALVRWGTVPRIGGSAALTRIPHYTVRSW
jgi:hypothetical protein